METIIWQGKGLDKKKYTITKMERVGVYNLWKNSPVSLTNLMGSGFGSVDDIVTKFPLIFDEHHLAMFKIVG